MTLLPIEALRGNAFAHGLPLDAETPDDWCLTAYPSRYCTCGACVLTWALEPPDAAVADTTLYAYPRTSPFVHAACPQDGSGALCTTVFPALGCQCGTYQLLWEQGAAEQDTL